MGILSRCRRSRDSLLLCCLILEVFRSQNFRVLALDISCPVVLLKQRNKGLVYLMATDGGGVTIKYSKAHGIFSKI